MENNNNEYLPEYILNGLTLRVIGKLDRFYANCMPNSNDNVIKACKMIEQNVQQVYSVIADTKRSMMQNYGNGFKCWHFLTSVYVLLYYRHRDDEAYQLIVFPQLKMEMGIYAAKTIIKQEVDKMLEEDACLRSVQEKKPDEQTGNKSIDIEAEKQIAGLEKENSDLRAKLKEYTGEEEPDGTKKPYFTTNQIAIAAYFLFGEGNIRVMDNQQAWAKFMSKMSRRNCQNIREALGKINSSMDDLKRDAIIVADALDAIAPAIAEKIRKNFDV
jgi:hypothetical protein